MPYQPPIIKHLFKTTLTRLEAIGVMYRLSKHTHGTIMYKLKMINKYYPVYIHHQLQQRHKFEDNLHNLHNLHKQMNEQSYKQRIVHAYVMYTNNKKKNKYNSNQDIDNNINNNINAEIDRDKNANNQTIHNKQSSSFYEKQARSFLHHCLQHLSLYYQSLQSIIQGRRQVLHDDKFMFEDGENVEEKRLNFERYLGKLLRRSTEELEVLEGGGNRADPLHKSSISLQ